VKGIEDGKQPKGAVNNEGKRRRPKENPEQAKA
jgi:hypothetical protein